MRLRKWVRSTLEWTVIISTVLAFLFLSMGMFACMFL